MKDGPFVSDDTRAILDALEAQRAERRELYDADVLRLSDADAKSRKGVNSLVRWVIVRAVIEVLILILLFIRL